MDTGQMKNENMDKHETSWEPMDVDMSANSTRSASAMDISYNNIEVTDILQTNSLTEHYRSKTPKSYLYKESFKENKIEEIDTLHQNTHRSVQKCENQENTSRSYRNLLLIFIVCFLSIVSYNVLSFKCFQTFDITSINQRLHTRLYGQNLAIENVADFFESQDSTKVLVLYGGTGVGKTFMVSLLFEDLFNNTNIYHYSLANLERTFTTESMFGITLCETSIIVIDDITLDKDISKYVKELIARSSNLNKSITIILIYNCANYNKQFISNCPNNSLLQIKSTLMDIDVMKKFVKFEPLNEDTLKKCIQYELRGDNINETDMNKMMRNFNVERDGCKGVHQKAKYLKM